MLIRALLGGTLVLTFLGCVDRSSGPIDGGGDTSGWLECHGGLPDQPVQCMPGSTCCHNADGETSTPFCCEPGTQCCVVYQFSGFASGALQSTCMPGGTPCPVFCAGQVSGPTCPNGSWCLSTGGCTPRCEGDPCDVNICCDSGYFCGAGTTLSPRKCLPKLDAGVDAVAD